MATKKRYIPKNIKAGWKASEVIEKFKAEGKPLDNLVVQITSYDHSRDVYGNGTSHYTCSINLNDYCNLIIVESGARREPVGYSGQNEAAIWALSMLGYQVDLSSAGSYDYHGTAFYPITFKCVNND